MTYQREGFSVNAPLNLERENVTIDFTSGNNFCPNTNGNPPSEPEKTENGWDTQRIKDKNLFWARLGPTGGYKGYETITGKLLITKLHMHAHRNIFYKVSRNL